MKLLAACAGLFCGLVMQFSLGHAADTTPLFQLAIRYEAAVENFERAVRSVRGIDRNDERMVDRLDEATAKMRLAASNPRHLNRLFHKWREVQKLHGH